MALPTCGRQKPPTPHLTLHRNLDTGVLSPIPHRQSYTTVGLKTNWEGNQEEHKPDRNNNLYAFVYLNNYISQEWVYSYTSTNSPSNRIALAIPDGGNRFVSTPYEAMAFVARPRSKALGARAGVGGLLLPVNNIDIGENSPTGLGDQRSDHSGLFSRSVQELQVFYQTLNGIVR
jgi:hypothetical protein